MWGTSSQDCPPGEEGDNIVWGTAADDGDNVVWGTDCAGADCDNVVWGNPTCDPGEECDNIVWGTADECRAGEECDNMVWGTSACDCQAGDECDNIVWGTSLVSESDECASWDADDRRTVRGHSQHRLGHASPRRPRRPQPLRGDECRNIVWGTAPCATTPPRFDLHNR